MCNFKYTIHRKNEILINKYYSLFYWILTLFESNVLEGYITENLSEVHNKIPEKEQAVFNQNMKRHKTITNHKTVKNLDKANYLSIKKKNFMNYHSKHCDFQTKFVLIADNETSNTYKIHFLFDVMLLNK